MAQTVDVLRFENLRGGRTVEVRTARGLETLAYVDINADTTYGLTLFVPYRGTYRNTTRKTANGAQALLDRHLHAQGMQLVKIEE